MTAAAIEGIPHETYLHNPALSVSGMKLLLPPNCPALFKYYRENRRPEKRAYDFGHVVHGLVLGDGPEIVRIDAADWRTKAAKDTRDEAYAAGKVPILAHEYDEAVVCAASVKNHEIAGRLFEHGRPEVSLFWKDEDTEVKLRGRLDWLREDGFGVDLKTAATPDPESFATSAAKYGYAQQQAMYEDGMKACGMGEDPSFRFVVVGKSAPYLVSVVELDPADVAIGRALNRKAIDLYRLCMERDEWPAYPVVSQVSLPIWWQRLHDDYEEIVID
jgi:hypothetical protein